MGEDFWNNLEAEVSEWSQKNFGDQDPILPAMGVGEEVGELLRAELKREQGIRSGRSHETYILEASDAVGDIVIYLVDYLTRTRRMIDTDDPMPCGVELSINGAMRAGGTINVLLYVDNPAGLARIAYARAGRFLSRAEEFKKDMVQPPDREVQSLMEAIMYYCIIAGINLRGAVEDAWESVKKRNWKENPQDGTTGNEHSE